MINSKLSGEFISGKKHSVYEVDGEIYPPNNITVYYDDGESTKARVEASNRGIPRQIMAKIAITSTEEHYTAKLNVTDKKPHSGSMTIE